MTKYIFVVLMMVSGYGVACVEDEQPTDDKETVIVQVDGEMTLVIECFTDECVKCVDDCLDSEE